MEPAVNKDQHVALPAPEREKKLPPPEARHDAEDEELFEIDLEVLDRIPPPPPPPPGSQVFETGRERHQQGALLANCILPTADICNAVPMEALLAASRRMEHRGAGAGAGAGAFESRNLLRLLIHG